MKEFNAGDRIWFMLDGRPVQKLLIQNKKDYVEWIIKQLKQNICVYRQEQF